MSPVLGKGRTTFPDAPGQPHEERRTALRDGQDDAAREQGRASRWQRRAQLQRITSIGRVRRCGTERDPEAGTVLAVTDRPEGRCAGIEGLVTCGSVWTCPVCAAKVASKRAEELATVLDAVHARGGSAFMLTLTIRHGAGDRLGLSREERDRRYVLDRRRKWRNRLDKIADRRDAREIAAAKGWDVDEHQGDADDILEASIRTDITEHDAGFAAVGRAAREQRESDTAELAALKGRRGCWDAVTDTWHAATSGRAWSDAQDESGLLGWVRVTEVTDGGTQAILAVHPDGHGYSGNGWHVHVHALLCFDSDVSTEYVAAKLGAGMHARWAAKARALGFDSSAEHGWDLRKTHRGDGDNLHSYFVKQAHEVTGAHRKEGKRRGGRTPMQLLADAVGSYRVEDINRWWEWEYAAENRRQLTWSTGRRSLRTLAGLAEEQTDQQIADEDDLHGEHRLGLPGDTARWLRAEGQYPTLLAVTERGGLDAARLWLSGHSLGWNDRPRPSTGPSTSISTGSVGALG